MEIKTKHSVLSVVVIAGLVIASLPFFLGRKDIPSEPILIKAPPFPDQAPQMITPSSEQTNSLDSSKVSSDATSKETPVNPTAYLSTVNPKIVSQQQNNAKENKASQALDVQKIQYMSNVKLTTNGELDKKLQTSPAKITSTQANIDLTKPHRMDQSPIIGNRLKLEPVGWVVQIGSFKDKTNALRIVNRLRENGYKAFFKEVETKHGNNTRVFVGPLNQQTAARSLATRLENDLHIHGMIITYKPLTL